MKELVSIIVPIYNVESYLKRAVDSILGQSYTDIEVILVDDGSPDNCGKICDEYAKQDERVKVIHKENGGLSDARNAGLDVAKGEYIAFVDSDDYIDPDFIRNLYGYLIKEKADVAMCSYEEVGTDKEMPEHISDKASEVCSRDRLLSNMYDANHQDATYFIVAWNKLYKASLWKDIRFPKGKIHEDEATTYKIYDKCTRGVYFHSPMYKYCVAPDSITRAKFNIKRLDWMDALTDRIAFFREKEDEVQAGYALRARADAAIHYYYPLREELPEERREAHRLKGYVTEYQQTLNKGSFGYELFNFSAPLYRWVTNIDRDKKERIYQAAFVLLMAWITLLCFYKLGVKYVDPWDESRHGVNAYEMLKNGHLIQSTYLYNLDYYNLKPPLSMWTIMFSLAFIGKGIFALRVPSAICYIVLCGKVGTFVRHKYGRMSAILSLALLSANTTPFLAHMVRAGDADSLFVLFFTLAMMSMLEIHRDRHRLYKCAFYFALAFLTKSFHAVLIVAIGGIYMLATGMFKKMDVKTWIKFILSAIVPIGAWIGFRLSTDGTKFLSQMWYTDVMNRSQKGFGSNEAGFGYYFSYYLGHMSGKIEVYLVALVLLVVAIMILAIKNGAKKTLLQKDMLGFALWIFVPTLLYSVASTKLLWYMYPVVTALLIVAGIVTGYLHKQPKLHAVVKWGMTAVVILVAGFYSSQLYTTISAYGVNGNQINDFQILIQDVGENHLVEKRIVRDQQEARAESIRRGDKGLSKDDILEILNDEEKLMSLYKEQMKGKQLRAFRMLVEDGEAYSTWAQQDVYIAEVYGDYLCKDGGIEAMYESIEKGEISEAVLFCQKELYENELLDEFDRNGYCPVEISERGEYIAILMSKED